MEAFDVAIIGGGVAGLSLASALAPAARVALIEAETQPAYHSTGRSAAILAQNYGDSLIRALTAWSEPELAGPDGNFLRPRGLVRVATAARRAHLAAIFADMARDTPLVWLEGEEVAARVPLQRPGWADCGFLNPAAADIDVAGLVQHHLRRARAAGCILRTGAAVEALARRGRHWEVRLAGDGGRLRASIVVNAAGAWADTVARMAGAAPLGLVPLRRTAVAFDAPEGTDLAALPMIVDADELFYLKPEGGGLMASPGDETPDTPGDSRPEEIDVAICLDRVERAFGIAVRRPRATWSGLRTFAPDRHPLCGWDAGIAGFYWLAGQGGSGVQTAPALARLAADDILLRTGAARTEVPGLARGALDPARLSRRREERRQEQGELQ